MDFPVDIAIGEVAAAVKAEGLAYEDNDADPYARVAYISNGAAAIEFSLDTNLIEASGILLATYDDSLGRGMVYTADFDPGSFRRVDEERIELTAHAFAVDLADSLSRSPRIVHAQVDTDWGSALSFELSL